jgi:ketosteroid isomerase-like protein
MVMEIDIDTLVDLRRIEQLKYDYCWRYDSGDLDALMGLFTDEAVCEMGLFGIWRGRDEIRRGYAEVMRTTGIPGSRRHAPANPQIEVDGDVARGRWYLIDYRTEENVTQPVRIIATYEDEYRRSGARWLVSHTSLTVHWIEP